MSIHTAVTLTSLLFVSLLVSKQGMIQISSNSLQFSKSRQLLSEEAQNLLGCDLDNDPRGSGRCRQFGITAAAVEVITKFAHRGSGRFEIGFLGLRNIFIAQA